VAIPLLRRVGLQQNAVPCVLVQVPLLPVAVMRQKLAHQLQTPLLTKYFKKQRKNAFLKSYLVISHSRQQR
jgi:hypothetical protein